MNLTIDASIVIKWFIAEPLYDEARFLLARRIQVARSRSRTCGVQ